ncbi:hypothetical protein ACLOJK_021552 [Asimina triloba]
MLQLFSSRPDQTRPMSSGSNSIDGVAAADFHLPDEILSVIPTDPYEQLDLARKITAMAIAARVSRLESEAGRLRQKLTEKDRTVFELQERMTHLEDSLRQSDARLRDAIDENTTLTSERDSLAVANKKLQRDLAKASEISISIGLYGAPLKSRWTLESEIQGGNSASYFIVRGGLLETFKTQLMQSLKDENSPTEAIDIRTCDHPVSQVSSLNDEGSNGYIKPNISHGFTEGVSVYDASRHRGRWLSLSPYITSQATSPNVISTAVTPGRISQKGFWCRITHKTTLIPLDYQYQLTVLHVYIPSTNANANVFNTLSARTPRIDGKEFFRQARNRLSYEQFSAFLANIKELNARKQSRELEELLHLDSRVSCSWCELPMMLLTVIFTDDIMATIAGNPEEGRRDIWYRQQGSLLILSRTTQS